MTKADIAVIGAGIAGVSVASVLARHANVLLIEAEAQPGYHATGRSAAYFAPIYGNKVVRKLTKAAEGFYRQPPDGFVDHELIRQRDWLFVGREDQQGSLRATQRELQGLIDAISAEELVERCPILDIEYVAGGLIDRHGGDLDVDAIMQGYLKQFRRAGGEMVCGAQVTGLTHQAGVWHLSSGVGQFSAPVIVNAGGAWADDIAVKAGLSPLGIIPKRRTALLVDGPEGTDVSNWPVVIDADEEFYFKPEAGALLLSPADETQSLPCDAQPEELDIAIAVDRFEKATTLCVKRVTHKWAGLRTFASDKTPVVGFDPRMNGFFWLAGQGGFGVQTAPGIAHLAASQLLDQAPAPGFESVLETVEATRPDRFID